MLRQQLLSGGGRFAGRRTRPASGRHEPSVVPGGLAGRFALTGLAGRATLAEGQRSHGPGGRAAQQQSPVSSPLLLMTDQEGGEVRRLPGAPVLSEKQMGESSDPALEASQAGTGAGQNLAGVGMNVNLAPVLDVSYKAGNFIDRYQRSYRNRASVVTACGQAFITAQQQTGAVATAKHFPGLGSATKSQDTDTGPVTLTVSLSELRSKDEAPYPASALDSGQLNSASFDAAVQRVTALRGLVR
jgi:beta-glucosidase-like glycosyl hydrolase